MNVERLQRLSKLLREDAANPQGLTFNLAFWGRVPSQEGLDTHSVAVNCGTQACAMGLAAISGEFKAEGLDYEVVAPRTWGNQIRPLFTDSTGTASDFRAAEKLFEISHLSAVILFDPTQYAKTNGAEAEIEVADRIDGLIANGEVWLSEEY